MLLGTSIQLSVTNWRLANTSSTVTALPAALSLSFHQPVDIVVDIVSVLPYVCLASSIAIESVNCIPAIVFASLHLFLHPCNYSVPLTALRFTECSTSVVVF